MRFAHVEYLWFLLTPFFFYFILKLIIKNNKNKLYLFAGPIVLNKIIANYSEKKANYKLISIMLALTLIVLALARPQINAKEEFVKTQGLDITILLDVSNSMLAEDVVPSRLKKSKHLIKNFLDKISGDRVGLVAFAGTAYQAVPLTTDYDFIKQTLEVLDETSISRQGSNLGKAINLAIELIDRGGLNEEADNSNKQDENLDKIFIILSDGEDNVNDEVQYVDQLKKKNIKIFSIGVGSLKGAPIPLRDSNGTLKEYKHDNKGSMVLTKLETKNLANISTVTGGKYFSNSDNEGEIDEIISLIVNAKRGEIEGKKIIVYEEYYQYPLILALLLFFLNFILTERKSIHVVVLFFLISKNLYANSLGEYSNNSAGIKAYQNKDYSQAIESFTKSQSENPDSIINHFNLGDAFYRAKNYEAAKNEYSKALNSEINVDTIKSYFNLAKTYQALKNHDQAIQTLQDGLQKIDELKPPSAELKLKFKRALEQAEQKKNQQNQQQDQDKKDQQDQNKQDNKNDQKSDNKQDKNDDKDQKKKDENQPPKMGQKPKFKQEKLSETDAKRIMQQLQEQEKKSQKRFMQNKTEKNKPSESDKDW